MTDLVFDANSLYARSWYAAQRLSSDPKEALRLVFDPFVVRSDSPLEYGINLMACYLIVHHHRGCITALSDPGQGTSFTLRLVVNPNQQPRTQDSDEFLQKVLLNERLWHQLISSIE